MSGSAVLVVEDDPAISALLVAYLEKEEFSVQSVSTASDALSKARTKRFDVVLIDLGLPDEDGRVLARKLRAETDIPIVFVTGELDKDVKLGALEMGGDDYITKPFDPRELTARIRNILRRMNLNGPDNSSSCLAFDRWIIDPERHALTADDGEETKLTSAEFSLLLALAESAGRVKSRYELLDAISTNNEDVTDRTIDVLVSRIRRKIESDPKSPKVIVTVAGSGYRLGVQVQRL